VVTSVKVVELPGWSEILIGLLLFDVEYRANRRLVYLGEGFIHHVAVGGL
jgi:hypothetical protein